MEHALRQIETLAWENREVTRLEKAIADQEAEIEKCKMLKVSTYEDLKEGLITQEEFLHMKDEYTQRICTLESAVSSLRAEQASIQEGLTNQAGWLAQFRKYRNIPSLSRAVVVNLIEKVYLYPGKQIKVVLRYQDQFSDIMEFLQTQKAAYTLPQKEVC